MSPQLPSNKAIVINEDETTLLAINKNLSLKEDSLLEIFVLKSNEPFKKNELGFWYKINKKTDGELLRDNELCTIFYTLEKLDGDTITREKRKFRIGKKEMMIGLEEGLKLLKKGETATLIIPWYLGYGMAGLENKIPAYTSVMCDVELLQ